MYVKLFEEFVRKSILYVIKYQPDTEDTNRALFVDGTTLQSDPGPTIACSNDTSCSCVSVAVIVTEPTVCDGKTMYVPVPPAPVPNAVICVVVTMPAPDTNMPRTIVPLVAVTVSVPFEPGPGAIEPVRVNVAGLAAFA